MNLDLLFENMTNPALLFFALGLIAVLVKSDFEIPTNSSKFISIYLLFSIGFKGGHELKHGGEGMEITTAVLFGILLAVIIPIISFFIIKKRVGISNAGAIAAAYGSVSAVTFITVIGYIELNNIQYGGYMVAVMAVMEAPSIIVGTFLINLFKKSSKEKTNFKSIIHHSLTNGSVLLILGSLLIGYIANDKQAMGIEPFTTDIFKGFLSVFLLDMGVKSGKKISALYQSGWFPIAFAFIFPLVIGSTIAVTMTAFFGEGNTLIFSILGASASYIAVPAAMKIAAPEANPGLYIPMALAITFPVNITLGIPLYHFLITSML